MDWFNIGGGSNGAAEEREGLKRYGTLFAAPSGDPSSINMMSVSTKDQEEDPKNVPWNLCMKITDCVR